MLIGVDFHVLDKRMLKDLAGKRGIKYIAVDANTQRYMGRQRVDKVLRKYQPDVLFIDGDHSYEGVKSDYLNFRDRVREGGVIAFHDIVEIENIEKEESDGRFVGGVPRFFDELKNDMNSKQFVDPSGGGGYGIGMIIKNSDPG